jgi:hypothetical protein
VVGQPDDPDEGEDAQLASAESEDLMGALEVEVEAADENARVGEDTGPHVDLQAFGAKRLVIPSKVEPVAHACHLEGGKPAVLPS